MGWMDSLNAAAKAASKKKLNAAQSEEIAKDLVMMSSFGSAVVTLVPIPFSDFVAVTAVQASMVTAIGRVYGRELNKEEAKHLVLELASVCGAGCFIQGAIIPSRTYKPNDTSFCCGPSTDPSNWTSSFTKGATYAGGSGMGAGTQLIATGVPAASLIARCNRRGIHRRRTGRGRGTSAR